MYENDERVLIAVSGIEQLESMHQQFMEFVQKLSTIKPHVGTLNVSDNNLVVTCLGVPLTVRRKIIAHEGLPSNIEYAFIVPKNDDDIVVFTMYLEPHGTLFTDPLCESRLCDYNNTYLANNVLNAVAIKLLDSEVFEPTEHG